MQTPYISFSNDTLDKLLDASSGQLVHCPHCSSRHALEPSSEGNTLILFYRCPETSKTYLGAIHGKLVVGMKPDISGSL